LFTVRVQGSAWFLPTKKKKKQKKKKDEEKRQSWPFPLFNNRSLKKRKKIAQERDKREREMQEKDGGDKDASEWLVFSSLEDPVNCVCVWN